MSFASEIDAGLIFFKFETRRGGARIREKGSSAVGTGRAKNEARHELKKWSESKRDLLHPSTPREAVSFPAKKTSRASLQRMKLFSCLSLSCRLSHETSNEFSALPSFDSKVFLLSLDPRPASASASWTGPCLSLFSIPLPQLSRRDEHDPPPLEKVAKRCFRHYRFPSSASRSSQSRTTRTRGASARCGGVARNRRRALPQLVLRLRGSHGSPSKRPSLRLRRVRFRSRLGNDGPS